MQIKTFFTLAVLGTSLCTAAPVPGNSVDLYTRSIQELGGTPADPAQFPETVIGFQKYLEACGVKSVTATELTTPNHPEVAGRLGFQNFLPAKTWWSRGAALALLTQQIESSTQVPVKVRNWWRPQAYNTDPKVKGAQGGDHPTANAVDLDYPNVAARKKAELFLRSLVQRCPWMQLSLGLGAQSTHVGLGSPRGHREWHYAGWQPAVMRRGNG